MVVVKKRQLKLFWIFFMAFILAIFMRGISIVNISAGVLLLIYIATVMSGNRDQIMAMMICCIPLFTTFQYSYAILAALIVYSLKYYRDLKMPKYSLLLIAVFIWEAMHWFGEYASFNSGLRSLAPFLVCLFIACNRYREYDYELITNVLSITTICVCFVIFGKQLIETNFNIASIFIGTYRFGAVTVESLFATDFNPNLLGFACVLAMTCLLQCSTRSKNNLLKYAMILLLVIFSIFTMSITAFVCMAVLFISYVISLPAKSIKKIRVIGLTVVGFVVAITVINIFFPSVITAIQRRLSASDVSNGRTRLFSFYLEHIFGSLKNAMWGIGMTNTLDKVKAIYGATSNVPHESFEEMIVCWGIPVALIGVAFFVGFIQDARHYNGRTKLLNYIPLLILLIRNALGQFITCGMVVIAMGVVFISLLQNFDSTKGAVVDE